MKDILKRMLGQSQAEPAKADNLNEGVVEMTDAVINQADAELASMQALDVAGMQAAIASLTADVAAKAAELASKDAKIAELSALVEAATEFKAAQEKAAAEAKMAARVETLAGLVGTESAASLQAATASMDDAAFGALTAALSMKQKVEADTPAFKEVGAEGSTDQTKLAAEVYGGKTGDYLQALIKENKLN